MVKKAPASAAGDEVALRLLEGADVSSFGREELFAGIDTLASYKSPEAADALARIQEPKEAAKAARRALFRLQSQGIKPTTRATTTAQPVEKAGSKIRLIDARISSYDPKGTRAIMLLCEKPFTGLMSFFVIANDGEGLLDAELTTTTKKAFFARVENFSKQYEYIEFVPLPPEYANRVIEEAAERNERSKQPLPQDYPMWKTIAADTPRWEGLPPIYRELVVDDVREKISLDQTQDLADTEFAAWIYDEEQLKEYVTRIETGRGGPLVVSPEAQKDREKAVIDDATDATFQGDELARAKERLQETAYLLLRQGNRETAGRCLRAALSVEETPPHQQPFLRALLEKSLDLAMEGELIDEDEKAGGPKEPARTDSGIILPA